MNKTITTTLLLMFATNMSQCMTGKNNTKPCGLKASLTQKLAMLSKQQNETQKKLDQEVKFRQDSDSKLANARAQILFQKNQLDQEIKFRQSTDSKLANTKAEILFQKNQTATMKSFMQKQDQTNRMLQDEQKLCLDIIENAELDLDVLKEDFQEYNQRIDKHNEDIEILYTSLEKTQKTIETVQESVDEANETIDALEDKVSDLQNASPCRSKKHSRSNSPFQKHPYTKQCSPLRYYQDANNENDNHNVHTMLSIDTGITTSPTKSTMDSTNYTPKSQKKEINVLPNKGKQATSCSFFQAVFKNQSPE